jgi:hypothetical protein
MKSVYLETAFISYLIARPSRDVIVAVHQQTPRNGGQIDVMSLSAVVCETLGQRMPVICTPEELIGA